MEEEMKKSIKSIISHISNLQSEKVSTDEEIKQFKLLMSSEPDGSDKYKKYQEEVSSRSQRLDAIDSELNNYIDNISKSDILKNIKNYLQNKLELYKTHDDLEKIKNEIATKKANIADLESLIKQNKRQIEEEEKNNNKSSVENIKVLSDSNISKREKILGLRQEVEKLEKQTSDFIDKDEKRDNFEQLQKLSEFFNDFDLSKMNSDKMKKISNSVNVLDVKKPKKEDTQEQKNWKIVDGADISNNNYRKDNDWKIGDENLEIKDDLFNKIWRENDNGNNGKGGIGTTPTPQPQPEKVKNDNTPEPQPQPEQQKKLPRHWVEIMADTQSQSSGSIVTNLHNMGKIQPFRLSPGIVFFPIKAAMKGIGLLTGDVIGRAEAKKREMKQNIEDLPPEEFEILVNGLTETHMRQYKVNNIYLEAVHEVLSEREARKMQELITLDNYANNEINNCRERIDKITQQLSNPALTEEQKNDLKSKLYQSQMVLNSLRMFHSKVQNDEEISQNRVSNFERGMRGKSSQKMNIQGWFAAKFNPNNIDLHKEMAIAYKERREAADRGDIVAVDNAQRKIEKLKTDNTHVIQFLPNSRFATRARINRGLHTREKVIQKANDADQNKAREIIAALVMGATLHNLSHAAHDKVDTSHVMDENQRLVNQKISEHNKAIDSVNEHNRGVQSEIDSANQANSSIQGQDLSQVMTEKQYRVAMNNEIHRNNMATHSVAHNGEFLRTNNGVGFNVNGSDDTIHNIQDMMTQARQATKGSTDAKVLEANNSYIRLNETIKQELTTAQNFMKVSGKAGFTNTEYVKNLQHMASTPYEQTAGGVLTSIHDLFENAACIEGTQVAGSVQMTPYMDTVTLSNAVADIPNYILSNAIPCGAALANVVNMERQKAQKNNESKNHDKEIVTVPNERAKTQNEDEATKTPENAGAKPIDLGLPEDKILRRRSGEEKIADKGEAKPIKVDYGDNRSRDMSNWGDEIEK